LRDAEPKSAIRLAVHCPFRGLLGVHSRYGLHTRADNYIVPRHPKTSATSGRSGCGVWLAPLENAAFSRRSNGAISQIRDGRAFLSGVLPRRREQRVGANPRPI
jgi:hypothetical protein